MVTITTKRAEKIARNINAMDLNYQRSDDRRTYRFWSNLNNKLRAIISELNEDDKAIIKQFCNEPEAQYFNLV